MKSTAHIKGHPLHPILVGFPIAFFTGCLLFEVLALFYENPYFQATAGYLAIAGVISGLLAAIPGLIDYLLTVPPESSAKKRATKHGLINTMVVIIFLGTILLRQNENPSTYLLIGMEIVGVTLMIFAGWMGGTLVYRNQIGVNPRYAGAGKWKEDYLEAQNGRVAIPIDGELKINQMKLIHVGDKRIVLCRTEKGYAAISDHCTHRGGSLAGGSMMCGTIQCPWHGSQFDVTTGTAKAGPASERIQTYMVEEMDGMVYVRV